MMEDMDLRRIRAMGRTLDILTAADMPGGVGTAFPASASAGLRFFRTDLGWPCYYDGTRWLTTWEFSLAFAAGGNAYATNYAATTTSVRWASVRNDYTLYLTYALMTIRTGGTNNGANYMTYTFVDSSLATLWTVDTSADGTNATVTKASAGLTQPGAARSFVRLDIATTGAPSAQFLYTPVMYARLIVP